MTDKTLGAYTRRNDTPGPLEQAADRLIAAVRDSVIPASDGMDGGVADGDWSPVRECPDKDVHWRYEEALSDASLYQDRAARAGQERDEAEVKLGLVTAASEELEKQLAAVREDRDGALALLAELQEEATRQAVRADKAELRAEKADCHDCIRDAAVIREPLTPEDITDEMVERAGRAYVRAVADRGYVVSMKDVHTREAFGEALTAALTEPPQRPDGAEEIERLITYHYEDMPAETLTALSDALAERYAPIEDGAA